MWGVSKQEYFASGRSIEQINLSDIEAVCRCGYITLSPRNEFEKHNGGLTVKRSCVEIVRNDGSVVRSIRGKNIKRYYSCNACVNDWK